MPLSQPVPPPSAVVAPATPSTNARSPRLSEAPVRVVRYGLDRAELGMSLAEWRAAAPDHATAPCAAPTADPRIVVCQPAAKAEGPYGERDRRAVFVDGVLARVAFSTSIDSFDGVMARLDKTFGRPAKVVRDTIRLGDGLVLPHVLMTWTNGLATIRLTDPEPPGGLLTVRATLNDDADRLPAANRG